MDCSLLGDPPPSDERTIWLTPKKTRKNGVRGNSRWMTKKFDDFATISVTSALMFSGRAHETEHTKNWTWILRVLLPSNLSVSGFWVLCNDITWYVWYIVSSCCQWSPCDSDIRMLYLNHQLFNFYLSISYSKFYIYWHFRYGKISIGKILWFV